MVDILAGHYHIVKPLGEGGFGQTFLARDSHLPGQPICVVKQFKPIFKSPEALETAKRLFNLEAEVLYRLGEHPQIPRLLAHFEQEGEFYLVQEFVEGHPLSRELAHFKQLDELAVIELLRAILQVLAFVHQQQVIHRDIKPDNLIRRSRDRKIALIDFGAVKAVQTSVLPDSGFSNFTVAVGSPGYMPSEQSAGTPDFSSDIYAVGMVCLQALSGLPPKALPKDPDTGEFSCALLRDRVSISPGLAAILDKMVRYDYRQRYENASEALQALDQLSPYRPQTHTEVPRVAPDAPTMAPTTPTVTLPPFASTFNQETESDPAPALETDWVANSPETQAPRSPVVTEPPTAAPSPLPNRQAYLNRQALLNKVSRFWIKGVLEASLHDQVLIALGLEERPDAVVPPWNLTVETPDHPPKTLPQAMRVIDVFDQLGEGRTLLILGEPGAGKTTTLLDLTRYLLDRAQQDVNHLIPVVFNLSSWRGGKQTIADWLIEELNTKYQIPKPIGAAWIREQQLLLLLDGLDEVQAEVREACVLALNAFHQQYGPEMVVCSRIKDYEDLSHRLNFETAIYLRALTPIQIQHYLDTAGAGLTSLKASVAADPVLQELAKSPLMLNIMILAYQGADIEELPKAEQAEEWRVQLLNAYIERMFQRRGGDQQYPKVQVIHWLSWLAHQMSQTSQTVFLIEGMQPSWLPALSQRRLYRIGVRLILGLMVGAVHVGLLSGLLAGTTKLIQGLIAGAIAGLSYAVLGGIVSGWLKNLTARLAIGIILGLVFGAAFGLVLGPIYGLTYGGLYVLFGIIVYGLVNREIEPVDILTWSWQKAMKNSVFGLGFGILLGITNEPIYGLLFGLILWLILGFTKRTEVGTRTVPNQGIWQSVANTRTLVASVGLSSMLILGVIETLRVGGNTGILFGFVNGVIFGTASGLLGGQGSGIVCIKHFTLRLLLWRNGLIPWNYARFLNYAVDHIFLQRVGGGYVFIHRLLLEHFAAMWPDQLNKEVKARSQ